jgi:hypothetical protein
MAERFAGGGGEQRLPVRAAKCKPLCVRKVQGMAERYAGGGGEQRVLVGAAARPPVLRRPRRPRGELLRGDAVHAQLRRWIQGMRGGRE